MANEVIIEEYAEIVQRLPIASEPITTQILDIAELSAAFDTKTKYIRIRSKGTGFWYKLGDGTVSATANTNGNLWVSADGVAEHLISSATNIDTAA